jgi:predicted metal-dependent HD superfamily phosphohydrolase
MSTPSALQPTESDIQFLGGGWRALTSTYGADGGDADRWLDLLTRRYSAHGRHYHNLHHVAEVLRLLEHFESNAADYDALRCAAWFHDAIYDTRSNANEDESAALAERALDELGVPAMKVDLVRRIILATKKHEAEGDQPDAGLFLDADLSILGASEETYLAYSEAIRQEYAWVPEPAYREGRAKVLTNFLRRERLFYTEALAQRFEAQARRNLSDEVRRLSIQP